jgi:hypothetical protein
MKGEMKSMTPPETSGIEQLKTLRSLEDLRNLEVTQARGSVSE